MTTTQRLLATVVAMMVLLGVGLVSTATPATAATPYAVNSSKVIKKRLVAAIRQLPVAFETPAGYGRAKFPHWTDQNRDGQNTRSEVLRQETKKRVTGKTTVRTGKWYSYYDGTTFTKASKLDIDHMVPLKEAWDSGAKRWTTQRRTAFANDLADSRSLVAVNLRVNRSKSDRDPGHWLPGKAKARYVREWTAVKIRWGLKIDRNEKTTLLSWANKTGNPVIKVRKAYVKGGSAGKPSPSKPGTKPGKNDPRFTYCYVATSHGYGPYKRGRDPEYWWYTDSDRDGWVCE